MNNTCSYLAGICSMVIFGSLGIFRKYIPVSSVLLSCIRGLVGSAFLLVCTKAAGKRFQKLERRTWGLLVTSGGVVGLNWMLLFEAYNYTTISVATMCYYMQPAIVILLSPLMFREKLTWRKLLCVLLSLVGMGFVSGIFGGQGGKDFASNGVRFALGAALLYAFVVILNKKVVVEDVCEKTIIQLVSAAVVLIPHLLLSKEFTAIEWTRKALFMMLVVGLVHTGVAYALYFGFSMPRRLPL